VQARGVSSMSLAREDTRLDVMDRQEEEGDETYNESANEILDPVTAEIEIRIRVGELCERKGGLLLADGTAGEVRLTERARGDCGVVEFDAFVEALDLVILHSGSVCLVSSADTRGSAFNYLLLHFVDKI